MNIDCFAGGGGASTGLEQAGYKIDIAINHDPAAILMHKTNHPDTLHLTEDIFKVDFSRYIKPNDTVDVMWASPDCTSHSRAKGGQPRENGLRILPWSVYRLCRQIRDITGHLPRAVFMENVEEIQKWCPLNRSNQPVKKLEGKCYRCFISAMTGERSPNKCCLCKYSESESLGFSFDSRVLVAADYGAPTTRKRWYAVFRSDDKTPSFPEPTHNKEGSNGLKPWVPVSAVIDWSDLGKSIFTRKKPLAEATMKRIRNGIKKYIINAERPFWIPEKEAVSFLIQYHSETTKGEARGQRLDEPIKTLDTSNRYGLISAFLIKYYGGEKPGQAVDKPLGTITTKDRFGLVSVFVTVDGKQYVIKDIFLRMLKPRELLLAQGFPSGYIIDRDYTGAKYPIKEQVARIGNSVVPVMAKAIAEANK